METKKLSDVRAKADDGRVFTIERYVTIENLSGIGDADYHTHIEHDYRIKDGEPVKVLKPDLYQLEDGTNLTLLP